MRTKVTKQRKEVEYWGKTLYRGFCYALDLMICTYMILILGIMPFYNQEGYSHIGTDKATFFHTTIKAFGKILPIVLVFAIIFKILVYIKENKQKDNGNILPSMWDGIKAYCKKEMAVTDWFALAYVICVVISYAFSGYKEEALWGTRGWFMGMIPHVAVVVGYFLIAHVWKQVDWIVLMIMPISGAVFLLGYLNSFGIYPIEMESRSASFISTIGNINWYCGYTMSVFFIGFILLWKREWPVRWQKILLMLYVAIGLATVITHGSVSGVVTLAVIILVVFCMSVNDGKRMELFWLEMLLFSGVCAFTYIMYAMGIFKITYAFEATMVYTNIIFPILMLVASGLFYGWVLYSNRKNCYSEKVFGILAKILCVGSICFIVLFILAVIINTASGGIIYELTGMSENTFLTFGPEWGSKRGATYMAGLYCFAEQNFLHKLVGMGPDCMAQYLYNDGSEAVKALVKEAFGNARLTNAHNEWLTTLVNEGIFGLITFVGMIVTAIKRLIGNHKISVVAAACGFCILAYTINNMFSFQQSMSLATIFVVLGIGENYLRIAEKKQKQ